MRNSEVQLLEIIQKVFNTELFIFTFSENNLNKNQILLFWLLFDGVSFIFNN